MQSALAQRREGGVAPVRMFLPALLIYKIGDNLKQDTGVRYVPIVGMSSNSQH